MNFSLWSYSLHFLRVKKIFSANTVGEFYELMSYLKSKRNDDIWLLLEVLIQQSIFALCKARGAWELTHVLLIYLELSHISIPRKTGSKSANPIRRSDKFWRSAHRFAVHFQILRRSSHPRRKNWYLGERINLTCNSDKTRVRGHSSLDRCLCRAEL